LFGKAYHALAKSITLTYAALHIRFMNAQDNNFGSGNLVAFIIGAVFNLVSVNFDFSLLINYTVQAVVGGIIFLLFKILGDVLRPKWQKYIRKMMEDLKNEDESH
jgi:membrane associated rhomboid family serine protease